MICTYGEVVEERFARQRIPVFNNSEKKSFRMIAEITPAGMSFVTILYCSTVFSQVIKRKTGENNSLFHIYVHTFLTCCII